MRCWVQTIYLEDGLPAIHESMEWKAMEWRGPTNNPILIQGTKTHHEPKKNTETWTRPGMIILQDMVYYGIFVFWSPKNTLSSAKNTSFRTTDALELGRLPDGWFLGVNIWDSKYLVRHVGLNTSPSGCLGMILGPGKPGVSRGPCHSTYRGEITTVFHL